MRARPGRVPGPMQKPRRRSRRGFCIGVAGGGRDRLWWRTCALSGRGGARGQCASTAKSRPPHEGAFAAGRAVGQVTFMAGIRALSARGLCAANVLPGKEPPTTCVGAFQLVRPGRDKLSWRTPAHWASEGGRPRVMRRQCASRQRAAHLRACTFAAVKAVAVKPPLHDVSRL